MLRIKQDQRLIQLQKRLQSHPIYSVIDTKPKLQIFMQSHSFAVWDFMVLLKGLQRGLTNVRPAWTPVKNINTARFINEIVLGEETDEIEPKIFTSHYNLYLKAMEDIGADTSVIKNFVQNVASSNGSLESALSYLQDCNIPSHTKKFVTNTLTTGGKCLPSIASAFCLGREDPIPKMFQQIVDTLPQDSDYNNIRMYLQRHIEVDGESHGPLSEQLLEEVIDNDERKLEVVINSGINSIEHRIKLWDGILADIRLADIKDPHLIVCECKLKI
jgi:hypothetical protein